MGARSPAGRPRGARGVVYHLKLAPGDLPPRVLVPGDPERARRIAESWDDFEPVAEHREFRSFRGHLQGTSIGCVSTGIGGPAMSIVVEELARIGVRTLIRVGSCGGLQRGMRRGDLVITRACLRMDGASRAYAPAGYPASADPQVYLALVEAAQRRRFRFHTGITGSVDAFYVAQDRPGFGGFLPDRRETDLKGLRALHIVNVEMESATLLTLANLYELKAGVVCAIFDAPGQKELRPRGEQEAITVANDAICALARQETARPGGGPRARREGRA